MRTAGNPCRFNPFVFGYGTQDRSTEKVKFGARWYDPNTGAWTQQDTLNAPLDPINGNRYQYAGGDPINNQDPTGRDFFDFLGDVAFGAATGLTCGAVGVLATPLAGAACGAGMVTLWAAGRNDVI